MTWSRKTVTKGSVQSPLLMLKKVLSVSGRSRAAITWTLRSPCCDETSGTWKEKNVKTHQERKLLLRMDQLLLGESPVGCHDNLFCSLIVCLFVVCLWFVYLLPTAALFWVANRPTPAPPSSLHLAFSQAADFVERQQQLQQTFCTEKAAAAGNQFCTPAAVAAVPHTQTPLPQG